MSKISVETIGPREARKYLDAVRDQDGKFANRRIDDRRVVVYARAMETPGAYDPNLPTVAFNGGNKLVGGFHTLLAVERSGTTWDFRVVRGLTENLIAALNDQRKGTAADELARLGVADANQVASAARDITLSDLNDLTWWAGDEANES